MRSLILRRGPLTAQVAIMTIVFSWAIGVPAGLLGAVRRNGWADRATNLFAALFLAVPSFWFGVVVVLLGVIYLS